MGISNDLISQFVKVTKDTADTSKSTTVYGTVVKENDTVYVQIDGSEGRLTPISPTTTDVENGDRVSVSITNHIAVITGNLSSPSARTDTVKVIDGTVKDNTQKITLLETVVADKVSTELLEAEIARIDKLEADTISVTGRLTASEATIIRLEAEDVTVKGRLEATEAHIESLEAYDVTVRGVLEANLAKIASLEAEDVTIQGRLDANEASINDLEANKLSATEADIKYATIDFANIGEAAMEYFYSQSGLIKNVTVGSQTITGELVGVTIKGDLIEGGTVKADKLVIKGTDGIYYKLNTDGKTVETEQTDQNSLNGSVIMAKTITASKISVTDLVAFGATIGGFHIADHSLYSGAKNAVSNTTRGVYLDDSGQVAFGDASNFVKFYKDLSGNYRLAISADEFVFSSSGTDISTAITNAQSAANDAKSDAAKAQSDIDNLIVGGRNILLDSRCLAVFSNNANLYPIATSTVTEGNRTFNRTRRSSTSSYPTNFSLYNTINPSQLSMDLSGEELTFSCLVRGSHATTCRLMHYVQINGVVTNLPTHNSVRRITTEWQRISATVTIPEYSEGSSVVFCFTPYTIVIPDGEINNLYIDMCEWKIEKGNRATDWTPAPEDVSSDIGAAQSTADTAKSNAATAQRTADTANTNALTAQTAAENAAKTATNYMNFTPKVGLTIGDMTASTLGRNILIDANSVDIRNGTTVLASYEEDAIHLGKESHTAVISLCNNTGSIEASLLGDAIDDWWKLNLISQNSLGLQAREITMDSMTTYWGSGSAETIFRLNSANQWGDNTSNLIDPRYHGMCYIATRSFDPEAYGENRQYIDMNAVDGVIIGQDSDPNDMDSQSAKIIIKASSAATMHEIPSITFDVADTRVIGGLTFATNNERIWGTCTDGSEVEIFQAKNSSNNTVIGWGNYDGAAGNTNVYGNGVLIRANNDISIRSDGGNAILRSDSTSGYSKVYGHEVYIHTTNAGTSYRPYYHGVDTIADTTFRGSGYVTNAGKDIYFIVPLAKPIVGNPTVSVASVDGVILRQNTKYTHGSAASTYVKPTKYVANVDESKNYVRIVMSFTDTTNVINNNPIGIDWNGKITFAYG